MSFNGALGPITEGIFETGHGEAAHVGLTGNKGTPAGDLNIDGDTAVLQIDSSEREASGQRACRKTV